MRQQLSTWGLARTTAGNNLEPLYEEIRDLYFEGTEIKDILTRVNSQLRENGVLAIGERTLYNQLNSWDLTLQRETLSIGLNTTSLTSDSLTCWNYLSQYHTYWSPC